MLHFQTSVVLSILLFISCNQASVVVHASFLAQPKLIWTYLIPGSGQLGGPSFRKGNSVSFYDDTNAVYATSDDGSLHIIYPEESFVFQPPAVASSFTECRSGVAFSPSGIAVYAVIDVPAGTAFVAADGSVGTGGEATSRIVAVNPDGTLKWLVSLSGYVVGTPVIGVDGTNIYVSHNIRNSSGDYEGFITVILGSKGVVLYSELQEADRIGPYGPLANTVGTDGSDLVMWADSSSDGYASSGGTIFMLVQSQNSSGLEVKSFSNSTFTSVTKPAFLNTSMWMGGHESRLAAWIIDGGSQEELPTWRKNVQPTERNVSQPLINAPVASNEGLLFVTGNSYDLLCYDSGTGELVWTDTEGRSTYMSEPRVSEIVGSDSVVYAIEALNGNLRQHNAINGTRNWVFDCSNVTGVAGCQDGVEAEFSISANGNIVYYGDIFGRVVALQVADFATTVPTVVPTVSPTLSPTLSTTSSTTTSKPVTQKPTIAPSKLRSQMPFGAGNASAVKTIAPSVDRSTSPPASTTEGSKYPSSIGPVASVSAITTPSFAPSANGGSQKSNGGVSSASAQNSGPSGRNQSTTIIMTVVIAASVALIVGLASLFIMRQHKTKEIARDFAPGSAEDVVEKPTEQYQRREYEDFCKTSAASVLAEIEQMSPIRKSASKLKSSPNRSPLPTTPSTLASIEETENEDVTEIASTVNTIVDATSPITVIENDDGNVSIESDGSDHQQDKEFLPRRIDEEDGEISIESDESDNIEYQEEEEFLPRVLSSIFDAESDDEEVNNDASGFLSTTLASMFGRANTESPPPQPRGDNKDDNDSDSGGTSTSSEHSGSSSGSNDRNGRRDHSDNDNDGCSYLPPFNSMFGKSDPPPLPHVEEEKKIDDIERASNPMSSHDDWSIDSSSVYIDDDKKLEHEDAACQPSQAHTPQRNPPAEATGMWNSILATLSETEKALGFTPDSTPKKSHRSILKHPDFPEDERSV